MDRIFVLTIIGVRRVSSSCNVYHDGVNSNFCASAVSNNAQSDCAVRCSIKARTHVTLDGAKHRQR